MLGRMMQVPMRKRGFDRRLARRRGGRRDRRWRGARGCAEGRSVGNVAVNVSPRLASPRGLAAVLQVFVLNPGLVFFKFFPILFSFPFLFRRFCEERREDHWWWEPVKSNYDESGRTSGVGILVNFFFFSSLFFTPSLTVWEVPFCCSPSNEPRPKIVQQDGAKFILDRKEIF